MSEQKNQQKQPPKRATSGIFAILMAIAAAYLGTAGDFAAGRHGGCAGCPADRNHRRGVDGQSDQHPDRHAGAHRKADRRAQADGNYRPAGHCGLHLRPRTLPDNFPTDAFP